MPRKASGDFNQNKYMNEWKKGNMQRVSAAYKSDFVIEFKKACQELGITQSDVIREAMQKTISSAANKQPR